MFPRLPARATIVAVTNFVSGTQNMFLILFRNILCPQQMFPSLRSPRNITCPQQCVLVCQHLKGKPEETRQVNAVLWENNYPSCFINECERALPTKQTKPTINGLAMRFCCLFLCHKGVLGIGHLCSRLPVSTTRWPIPRKPLWHRKRQHKCI